MPTYHFKNIETEEVQEVFMSISKIDEFKKDNPHLQQIILSPNDFVTGSKSARTLAGTEWNNFLTHMKKKSGRGCTIRD